MMAKSKIKGNLSKGEELIENPEVLAEQISKTEEFLDKNKMVVFTVGGVLAAIVAAYFFYNYWITNRNEMAQNEMFQAVYYFEADSLDKALDGDGNNYGFIEILDEFSMTDAANLANFYAGASYLKKGEYISAVDHLNAFSSSDLLMQARALALLGDANMEMENFEEAVDYYNKASNYNPNEYTTPAYLIKAAIAYEKIDDLNSALKCYSTIVEEFVNASEYQLARKHKARLEGKTKAG